ncbi:hypothetical protein MMC30_003974 [Trapelia coarctata]|nr:hypothetical protein [Trapelia coarctata]
MDRDHPHFESVLHIPQNRAPTNQTHRTSYSSDTNTISSHSDAAENDGHSERGSNSIKLSKKSKLHSLKSKTKAKTKALLHLEPSEPPITVEADCEDGGALSNIQNDPAFHPTRVIEEADKLLGEQRGPVDKTVDRLKNLGTTIAHPRTAIKTKAKKTTAAGLSSTHPPQLSQRADQQLLELHDDLSRAEWRSSMVVTSDEEECGDTDVDHRKDKITKLEEYRESMRVAWATKHIDRVRAVPQELVPKPKREAFMDRNENGEILHFKWAEYLGHLLLCHTQPFSAQYIDAFDTLPFDIDTLRAHTERLVIASAPWQKWLMDVRKIYRWEDPKRTFLWLCVYITCWYYQFFLGFVYGYIIYLVLANRYFPSGVQALRESERRTEREGTAFHLGELMHKHGPEGWIEPLVGEVGPFVQVQVGDVADMLEVFANFYAWKTPHKTTQTLLFFTTCLLISLITDIAYAMKIFWFVAGGAFFLCWPISSRYPKYRHLVSPLKWVLWDIPTDAEAAFMYLQEKAREGMGEREREYTGDCGDASVAGRGDGCREDSDEGEEKWHTPPSTPPSPSEKILLAFRAHYQSHTGRLLITTTGIRFVTTSPLHKTHHQQNELFGLPYLLILEMRKLDNRISRLAKVSGALPKRAKESGEDLLFLKKDGGEVLVQGVAGRDEAFNAVVGFSGGCGVRWVCLQRGGDEGGRGKGGGGEEGGEERRVVGEVGTMGAG